MRRFVIAAVLTACQGGAGNPSDGPATAPDGRASDCDGGAPSGPTVVLPLTMPSTVLFDRGDLFVAQLGSLSRLSCGQLVRIVDAEVGGLQAAGDSLYWVSGVAFGETITIATRDGSSTLALAQSAFVFNLALDADALYWVSGAGEGTTSSALMRMSNTGGPVLTLASWTGAGGPAAVDDQQVYFAQAGAIMKLPKSGGTPIRLTSGEPEVTGLAIDDGYIYWTMTSLVSDDQGAVERMPLDGSAGPSVVAANQLAPVALAVDGGAVYWTSMGSGASGDTDGSVMKWSAATGMQIVASSQHRPVSITLAPDAVYWVDYGTFRDNGATYNGDGALMKAPR